MPPFPRFPGRRPVLLAAFVLALLPAVWAGEVTPDPNSDTDPSAARRLHLDRLGVPRWQAEQSRGRGVRMAVLDSGFRGYRDHLGKALPARVAVRSFRRDGNLEARDSQHGILCGEVIHALAPEAELLLANWEPERPDQFLDAVRWARRQGARVLSCSLIMPSWSDGEGGGAVHAELGRLLGGALCFACAGNTAERHWSGPFRADGDGFHAWQTDESDNELSPWGRERVSVELCARPGLAFDLYVYEEDAPAEVGRSRAGDRGEDEPAVVRFEPRPGRTYRVRVRQSRGPAGRFHLAALGANLRHTTARGSIPFPGDGPHVVTVGAVDAAGQRLRYSSCGPNSPRPKPDFVAPVPFPSLCRARPFSGTSAAAPQAAGLAALLWSRHPDWTADQVRTALRAAVRDLGPAGHDHETGYGLIGLPITAAAPAARAPAAAPAR